MRFRCTDSTLLRITNPENRKTVSKTVVNNLMGNKPELRFEFIREKANLYENINILEE